MKTYVFTKKESRATYGTDVVCSIYRVKNNMPIYVGECKYNTGSTKGAESEVFAQLVRLKEVPKSWLELSRTPSSGSGYYNYKVQDKGLIIKGL